MKVQTVTVEVHEKRAHPSEMGHYDSSVTYTVQIDEGESAEEIVINYQFLARQHVAIECDRWVQEIERKSEMDSARSDLNWMITCAADSPAKEFDEERFGMKLAILPSDEQSEYVFRLEAAKAHYTKTLERALQVMIDRAQTRGFGKYDRQEFEYALEGFPESECAAYRARLEAALAPKPEATQEKTIRPKEDTPF